MSDGVGSIDRHLARAHRAGLEFAKSWREDWRPASVIAGLWSERGQGRHCAGRAAVAPCACNVAAQATNHGRCGVRCERCRFGTAP